MFNDDSQLSCRLVTKVRVILFWKATTTTRVESNVTFSSAKLNTREQHHLMFNPNDETAFALGFCTNLRTCWSFAFNEWICRYTLFQWEVFGPTYGKTEATSK